MLFRQNRKLLSAVLQRHALLFEPSRFECLSTTTTATEYLIDHARIPCIYFRNVNHPLNLFKAVDVVWWFLVGMLCMPWRCCELLPSQSPGVQGKLPNEASKIGDANVCWRLWVKHGVFACILQGFHRRGCATWFGLCMKACILLQTGVCYPGPTQF